MEITSVKLLQSINQCCGSALVSMRIRIRIRIQHFLSMWIRIQHFLSMRIRIQIQDFDDKKLGKKIGKHLALQTLNFLKFCESFWPSWIRIRIALGIRIRTKMNANPCGPDPNPQHWYQHFRYTELFLVSGTTWKTYST
jgi:hypothetical protein